MCGSTSLIIEKRLDRCEGFLTATSCELLDHGSARLEISAVVHCDPLVSSLDKLDADR